MHTCTVLLLKILYSSDFDDDDDDGSQHPPSVDYVRSTAVNALHLTFTATVGDSYPYFSIFQLRKLRHRDFSNFPKGMLPRNGRAKTGPQAIWFHGPAFKYCFSYLLSPSLCPVSDVEKLLESHIALTNEDMVELDNQHTVDDSRENHLANKGNKMKP